MRDSRFPLPSYLSLTGLKVNKMDGSAKEEEEEEDRAFTNISLADDTDHSSRILYPRHRSLLPKMMNADMDGPCLSEWTLPPLMEATLKPSENRTGNAASSHPLVSMGDWFQDPRQISKFTAAQVPQLTIFICRFCIGGFNQLPTMEYCRINWGKKSTYTWIHAVQTCVVQGSMLF
ncbi:short coiled-coil protein isoform X2 [Dama dama]|uniref:short coiled-coil protein isoform X2 n=1 Tax=Dama dama TaxID=30532 RepID=UPI002A3670E7|nr:short coiled-coil protein isoform X2 [Dama dama]